MSFRELRNFTEIMRALGYPRLISIENFRQPNFELVADCLYWLVLRYDPQLDVDDSITTESERVAFLKTVSQLMASRARIKLNMRRLYAADGHAVKELLKIASMLYQATKRSTKDDSTGPAEFQLSTKAFDVKQSRHLASEITTRGAALYDMLEAEHELKDLRQKAINRNLDSSEVEACVREAMSEVHDGIRGIEDMLENLEKDKRNLESKIEKRKADLGRKEKQLSNLETVRPAYMDDYEKLQWELQELYTVYLERFRNLEYLEMELDHFDRAEQEKMEDADRQLKKMQRRLRDEEMRILRGESAVDESQIVDDLSDDDFEQTSSRPSKAAPGKSRAYRGGGGGGGGRGGNVAGNLMGGDGSDLSDFENDDGSSASDDTHVSLEGDESVDDLLAGGDGSAGSDSGSGDDLPEDGGSSDGEF